MTRQALVLLLGLSLPLQAASFSPRDLFHVPLGSQREALGTRIDRGNFSFPRDFTIDTGGRFYIYDTHKHRIARFSRDGRFEASFSYPPTARQVFAHADSQQNLWLLITEPQRGLYYGVYDARGRKRRDGLFAQFNQFRLHVDADSTLQIILSSDKRPSTPQTFIFHEPSLLLKKIDVPPPPENHHAVRKAEGTYFLDAVPGAGEDASLVYRITAPDRRTAHEIKGRVIYVTDAGEIYTRLSERQLNVYDTRGALLGTLRCAGLASSCAALRFDGQGNIYQLDGIPDAEGRYTAEMSGLRMRIWDRR